MVMKAQIPAQGLMLQGDYGKSKNFKVECDCGSEDHAAYMWIEVAEDKEVPDVEVSFYVRTWTPLWEGGVMSRIKAAYEIIFKGVHKQEHHMLLSKQSALNFAETIKKTVKEMEGKK
jgi:hypothetical protein